MMPRLFVTDRVESATRKSTAPRDIRPEVVSAPQVPSLCSQYIIGLLGICLVFVPMLEALGTYINLGLPLRIGGIFVVALAVAVVVQIKEWVMYAEVALGLGLFGLGCFGPTDAIVDILFCCIFGFLITVLAAVQAENFKPAPACEDDLGRRAHSPAGGRGPQLVFRRREKACRSASRTEKRIRGCAASMTPLDARDPACCVRPLRCATKAPSRRA
jgi:hypothetical protein